MTKDGEGFEPSNEESPINGLVDRRHQPLGQPSISKHIVRNGVQLKINLYVDCAMATQYVKRILEDSNFWMSIAHYWFSGPAP